MCKEEEEEDEDEGGGGEEDDDYQLCLAVPFKQYLQGHILLDHIR